MSDFVKALGIVCWLGAAYFISEAMYFDVEVDVPAGDVGMLGSSTVVNLHLMHIQMLGFLAGCFLALNGSILFVGGLLMGRKSKD